MKQLTFYSAGHCKVVIGEGMVRSAPRLILTEEKIHESPGSRKSMLNPEPNSPMLHSDPLYSTAPFKHMKCKNIPQHNYIQREAR